MNPAPIIPAACNVRLNTVSRILPAQSSASVPLGSQLLMFDDPPAPVLCASSQVPKGKRRGVGEGKESPQKPSKKSRLRFWTVGELRRAWTEYSTPGRFSSLSEFTRWLNAEVGIRLPEGEVSRIEKRWDLERIATPREMRAAFKRTALRQRKNGEWVWLKSSRHHRPQS